MQQLFRYGTEEQAESLAGELMEQCKALLEAAKTIKGLDKVALKVGCVCVCVCEMFTIVWPKGGKGHSLGGGCSLRAPPF